MSANLELYNRLLVLRVSGELKKSELDAVQSEFVAKMVGGGTVKLLVLLENFIGFFSHRNDFEKSPLSALRAGKHRCWRSPVRVSEKGR